mgnify:CR=1 FL=1
MSPTTLIIVALVLLVLAAVYLMSPEHWRLRPRRSRTWSKRSRAPSNDSSTYHAVSIVGECSSARALAERRFLVRNAPKLPLPGCHHVSCHCKYIHYEDRRSKMNTDRRSVATTRSEHFILQGNTERRTKRGRRADDMSYGAFPVA